MGLIKNLLASLKGEDRDAMMEELIKALPYEDSKVAEPQARIVPPAGAANVNMLDEQHSEPRKGLDFDQLEAMSKVHIVSAIIGTRSNQMAEFTMPQREGLDIGFQIRLKDDSVIPKEEDLQMIEDLYDFMNNCGDKRLGHDVGFEGFMRMLVRDSLIYDQACFEIIRNRKGEVAGFQNVDSSTIRRAKLTKKEREAGRRDPDGVHYVQVVNDKVMAEFKNRELCFGVRRPVSKLGMRGYGNPELGECVGLITNLLNAETFNAANFSSGVNVNGIIAVKSRMNPQLFRQFRKEFYAMLSVAHNAKKTPLIQLSPDDNEGIDSITLNQSNRDMEFGSWHTQQIKGICSLFAIDPFEIGYKMGSEGIDSALQESSGITRLNMSKDKGLRPLVRAVQSWLNAYIIEEIDPRFVLEFTGLDQLDPREQLDRDRVKVANFMTINELRTSYELPLIEGGDIILNDHYIEAMKLRIASEISEVGSSGKADEWSETPEVAEKKEQEKKEQQEKKKEEGAEQDEGTMADKEAAEQGGREGDE